MANLFSPPQSRYFKVFLGDIEVGLAFQQDIDTIFLFHAVSKFPYQQVWGLV